MAITQLLLVKHMEAVNESTSAKSLLRSLLVESLSTQNRQVYEYVRSNSGCLSIDVSSVLGIKQNHAGTILKSLLKLNLVRREPIVTHEGLHYKWYESTIQEK